MATSASYTLVPANTSGGVTGQLVDTTGGGGVPCDQSALGQQHFLELFDRILPESYIRPIRDGGGEGYELFQALAKLGHRLSTAVNRFECGQFIIYAQGGQVTEVEVEFTRPDASAGSVTVKRGTRVSTSVGGRVFELVEDVAFGAAATGPVTGTVQAVAEGWEWNVDGEKTTAGGETIAGQIDTVDKMVQDPAGTDFTIEVRQVADATGGRAAMLDGLGANRGIPRADSEPDADYRVRLRTLPDTVSPAAIKRLIASRLDPHGLEWNLIETFEHRYQECYDAPSPNSGTPSYDNGTAPTNPDFDPNTFVLDDPRSVDTVGDFQNRTMDRKEYRAAFVLVVPNNVTIHDVGFALDDPGSNISAFLSPKRGTPAYDVPSDADQTVINHAFLDGFDIRRSAIYKGLYDNLQQIRAAGVAAVIDTIRP